MFFGFLLYVFYFDINTVLHYSVTIHASVKCKKSTSVHVLLRREHSGHKQLLENFYWMYQSFVTQNSMFRVHQIQILFVEMFVCFPQGRRKRKDAKENETGEATGELLELIETPQYLCKRKMSDTQQL